jgi:hypothetical protein
MDKRRYSIWGRELGADHDVELAQVDSNPQPILDALISKVMPKTKTRKYTWLRIVENKHD